MNRIRRIPENSANCLWLCGLSRCALVWVAFVPCVVARGQDGAQFGPRTLDTPNLASTQFRARERSLPPVSWDEQELRGAGPGYRIRFENHGFVFSTADDARIRGVTESVGRRSDSALDVQSVRPGRPVPAPQGVSYQLGTVVERYDLRADGVELSYVFDELPQGAGDLVVRLKIVTALDASVQGLRVDTLSFDVGERPAISVGAVIGVDADGRRVQGSMSFGNGMLELVLPEHFVDGAALPFTLDPIIGSVKYTTTGGPLHRTAAYDPVSDVFVTLWASGPNQSNVTMLAQLLSPSGGLLGPPIVIGQLLDEAGDVVSIAARGRFLLSYGNSTTTYLRTLDPVSRTLSPAVVAAQAPAWGAYLSGDMSTRGQALGVWSQGTSLSAAAVDVDAAGNVSVRSTVPLTNALFWNPPDVSASAGVNGRHMVVWSECTGPCVSGAITRDIWGAIIGQNGVVLETRLIANSARDEFYPYVDGDGSQWLVAYGVASPGSSIDAECAMVYWDSNTGSSYIGSRVSLSADPTRSESPDPVVFTGGAYVTSFDDGLETYQGGGEQMLVLDAIDGRRLEVGPRLNPGSAVLGASQHWRRSGPGDIAMLVDGATAYWYRVDDGTTTDLGGGCGRGGHIGVSGAVSKVNTMTLHLRDALPAVPAVLIVGSATVNLPCGPCTLVPDPATGITLPLGVTDNHGNASVQVSITNLFGVTFIEQWAILGGNACALGLELSNAVQVQIQ